MPPRLRSAPAAALETRVSDRRVTPEPETRTVLMGGSQMQSQLAAFRREGRFCDVVVRVGGREFPAHRLVLVAGSDMIAALSEGDRFADSASPIIELKNMSSNSFETVLAYLYDGTCACARNELPDVGAAAAFLQVAPLFEQAGRAIGSALGAKNCVASWIFATKFSLPGLADRCRNTMLIAFAELGDTLHALPPEEMRWLLAADALHVLDEREVLKAALDYAGARQLRDDRTLADFFSSVRFTQLSANAFDGVMQEPLFAGAACREMLLRAFATHAHGRSEMPRKVSAEKVKGAGKSAEQAKAMGVDAGQMFAFCTPIYCGKKSGDIEGRRAILDDGKYGRIYARDQDGKGPWDVILDGANLATEGYYHVDMSPGKPYPRMRLLEWA